MALALVLGYNTIRSNSVYESNETGTLRDAEVIALDLEGILRPGDRVLAVCPSDGPLEYYFGMHGIPVKYLWEKWDISRIFIVANKTHDQTLAGVVEEVAEIEEDINLDLYVLDMARLVKEYDSALLYRVDDPVFMDQ